MSSDSESDRLRDIADDLRIVHQLTEELAGDFELGFFGRQVCIVGTGIGVIACTVIGLSEVAASGLGIASTTLIGTDLVCLACLIWVVRRALSRTRTPGNQKTDFWMDGVKAARHHGPALLAGKRALDQVGRVVRRTGGHRLPV